MKTLDLYITKICNLNCEYCYVDLKTSETPFDSEEFIQRVHLLKYDEIKFFGGEPLLKWHDICTIIELVRLHSSKIRFTIVTNGLLLDVKKIKYLQNVENIFLAISAHHKGFKNLVKMLPNIENISNKISFGFIFEVGKMKFPLQACMFLYKRGFRNFIFTPEIYSSWNDKNLSLLQKNLTTITLLKEKLGLHISGHDASYLPQMNYGCHKTVYNTDGKYSLCNRFLELEKDKKFSYKKVYDAFDPLDKFKIDPNRWFATCPIGWYLDHKDGGENSYKIFKRLNEICINFYRQLDKDKINFLTPNITSIRFNLTNQCNLRCNYCYLDFNNNQLSFATGKNIVDFFFAQKSDSKQISFFGGEPLLCFDTLKKLVEYTNKQSEVFQKPVNYAIATNFLLITQEKIDFLREYHFEIHISFNGIQQIHDETRDNSFNKAIQNFDTYLSREERKKIIILLGFGPNQVQNLCKSILSIKKLGFTQIKFEMFLGEKFQWTISSLRILDEQIRLISHIDVEIYKKNNSGVSLDISPEGKCAPTSFDFHHYFVDYTPKHIFDKILEKYLF